MPDLTQREIDLLKAKNFAHLVTLNEDGSAHSAPLWIDVDDDGLVLVNSAVGRKKDRNIRRDPRVVVSVHSQDDPTPGRRSAAPSCRSRRATRRRRTSTSSARSTTTVSAGSTCPVLCASSTGSVPTASSGSRRGGRAARRADASADVRGVRRDRRTSWVRAPRSRSSWAAATSRRSSCGGRPGPARRRSRICLANQVGADLMQLSAVSSGVADARKVMEGAKGGLFRTVLFVDEVHRWSKAQQDVLLPAVEAGTVTLIGATTENPYFSLNTPLLSRCLLLRLEPLGPDELKALMLRALDDPERGLGGIDVKVTDEALDHLAEIAGGDARMALTGLEAAVLAARRLRRDRGDPRSRGRGGAAQGRRVRPAGRRPLRRDLRVHQEHPRLGPRRRAVLAGAHARGGGGRPLHRPTDDRARVGGHRARGPARAAGRVGGRPRRGARRAARGAVEPGRGGDLPGARAEVEQRVHRAREGDGGRGERRPRAGAPAGFVVSGRQTARSREGIQVPARLPRPPGGAGVPAGQVQGTTYYEPSGEGEDT